LETYFGVVTKPNVAIGHYEGNEYILFI